MLRCRKKECFFVFLFVVCCSICFISQFAIEAKAETALQSENNYELQDSTFYENGEWIKYYNCYAYAIGHYNKLNGVQLQYIHIGGPSTGNEVESNASISEMAMVVKADLEALSCVNVAVTQTKPTITNKQKLICLRKNSEGADYHFMTYNIEDGYWYHKPGNTAVLRYNYEPSNDRVWTNEYYDISPRESTLVYDSEIYYIAYTERLKIDVENGGYAIGSYEDFGYIEQYGTRDTEKGNTWSITNSFTIPSSVNWTPIDNAEKLVILGNGYTISGLKMQISSDEITSDNLNFGFIGVLVDGSFIQDLTFGNVEIYVTGAIDFNQTLNIGAIAAVNEGSIINCTVGNIRIYGEAHLSSNTYANIGGICGLNEGTISSCNINYCGIAGFGNIGGIAGKNSNDITGCSVNNSNMGLYYGTAGGIAGKNEVTEYDANITGCTLNSTTISCYNGYPDTLSQYYPSEHYAYVGGICGQNLNGAIKTNTIKYSEISYYGEATDSRTFAPEMGTICGRSTSDGVIGNTVTETATNKGELQTLTWKGGFLNLTTYTWNQAQYVGGEVGRYYA